MNLGQAGSRGTTRDSSSFPGGAREGCVAATHWLARLPGEDTSRGGTVLPRRVAGGAALAQELPRRVAEAPSLLHRPDRAFNEA